MYYIPPFMGKIWG